ncbi:two-component system sensor histidine kinase DesK [Actinoplanes lutulentus]|uniref:Two-component system sensor histidine kinase DesK n=1 Tax=Actinoplanes lutulentus TaxID=1287878 RepID=A0A327Z1Z8_9ACTN|nr:histidine kinase [Actinoplanes lutulentus]MBB2949259.1 two-component system sensor histidine kinase DesK [Actinoplanes lutulentus]RAK28780.1 two-component system sensor histidine kinase DesK [Actinoplanes lutulentus]
MTARSLRITATTQGRLRRLNLLTATPPLVVTAALLSVKDTDGWWQIAILASGMVAALVAFERWTANDLGRVFWPCLAVAIIVWPLSVMLTDSGNGYWGICVVGSLGIPRLRRHTRTVIAGLLVYIAAVGLLGDGLVKYLLIPVGITAIAIGSSFLGERFYAVVEELEQSKAREAELAVIRERVRFAGDLHDIQGHTLHVVKLKTTLARKLVRSDPARAEEELREIHALVSDTITQTKELAYAQRRLNLNAELENAKNLFEAAGIRVRISRDGDPGRGELFGQVLRETTTNILRHAQASQVRITLSAQGITIVNDGATGDTVPELRGLSALRQKVAGDGGELLVSVSNGEFTTAARFGVFSAAAESGR